MARKFYVTKRSWLRLAALGVVTLAVAMPLNRVAQAEEKKEKTELHHRMKDLDDAMKKLRATLKSADKNPQSLELIAKIEQLGITCKALVPSKAATVPEADRPKFIAAYRKDMALLIAEMCKMEAALLDGNNDKAQESYDALKDQEEKSHDKFNEDDEK